MMAKRVLKIFGIILLIVFVGMQFVPTNKVNPPVDASLDLLMTENFDAESKELIKSACYDCHSHETKYPWYSNIAPVSFFLEDHITEGREELNFSEFQSYSPKKKDHKLEEVIEALNDGWMPLDSYVLIHDEAELSKEQRSKLAEEFSAIRTTLNYKK